MSAHVAGIKAELCASGEGRQCLARQDRFDRNVATTTVFASRWFVPRLAKLKQDIDLELKIEASETLANLHSDAPRRH